MFSWVPVKKVQRELSLTPEALAETINDSRDMVKNRLKQRVDNYQ